MKKILFFLLCIFSSNQAVCDALEAQDVCCCDEEPVCKIETLQNSRFNGAFSAGYVFKHDDRNFRDVYGFGMGNVITADGCYNFCNLWGIGAKISYWLALGRTTFFKRHTTLHEIPVTVYVRKMFDFRRGLRLYASLGGGFAWIKESSYLGNVRQYRGIGEVEAGLMYPVWHSLYFTSAFRYLFPRQSKGSVKIDVGGFDLRAGLGFSI